MKRYFSLLSLVVIALVIGGAPKVSYAQTAPDNTAVNKRDRNTQEPTADQQKNNKSDRDITQEIRKSLIKDKSLSTDAHNVKIIAQHGAVTLKGPVRSEEEKNTVEEKAREVAGAENVTSELAVASK